MCRAPDEECQGRESGVVVSKKQGVVRVFAHHLGQKGYVSRPGRSKRGRSPCLTENPTRDELLRMGHMNAYFTASLIESPYPTI